MKRSGINCAIALAAALGITACGGPPATDDDAADDSSATTTIPSTGEPIVHHLVPLPGKEAEVPEITQKQTVVFETTAGEIVIEVYPEAAPNAAAHFIELVEAGYYDNTPIFRIVPGFVAQFGINWREPFKGWRDRNIRDDDRLFAHERGTLSFAKSGAPNTASTQVFINYAENNFLADDAPNYRFVVFAAVVEGMDVVDNFAQVGELNQGALWEDGDAYINQFALKPTEIESATVRDD
jgi:cyclophilin family peptidyl-prolyl cis-trans isomerase